MQSTRVQSQQLRANEHDLRLTVFQAGQFEPGLRALLELAKLEREQALASWRRAATPEELIRQQTRYNSAQMMIDFVTQEPPKFNENGRLPK